MNPLYGLRELRNPFHRLLTFGAFAIALVSAPVAFAQSPPPTVQPIVVPNAFEFVEGSVGNCIPLRACLGASRYQQVYASSEFSALPSSGPVFITAVRFRPSSQIAAQPPASVTYADVEIRLSTTSADPASLSTVFDQNTGSDVVTVFRGELTLSTAGSQVNVTSPFDIVIQLQSPFRYDPSAGNLLFEWQKRSNEPDSGAFFADFENNQPTIARAFGSMSDPDEATGAVNSGAGLITRFDFIEPEQVSVVDLPTPTGTNIPVVPLPEVFSQVAASVVQSGTTDAFFCVLPDTRWTPNGGGGFNFMPTNLNLGSLAGQGTCTGELVPGEPETWESEIFPNLNLVVPSYYRSYLGRVTLPGQATPTEGYWLVLGIIRSSAEFDGPVSYVTFPESLVDYSATPANQTPECDQDLAYRSLDIAGAVPAFGDFPNFEGNRMILQTAQCNRSRSMTRRTTHVYPVRFEYPVPGPRGELAGLYSLLAGIRGTIVEASSCADPSLLANIQASLTSAQMAIRFGNYDDAEEDLEEIARSAKNAESFGTGFAGCDIERNYRGGFMSRAISAAFIVHDRFQHPTAFVKYFVPADLEIPLLDPEFVIP